MQIKYVKWSILNIRQGHQSNSRKKKNKGEHYNDHLLQSLLGCDAGRRYLQIKSQISDELWKVTEPEIHRQYTGYNRATQTKRSGNLYRGAFMQLLILNLYTQVEMPQDRSKKKNDLLMNSHLNMCSLQTVRRHLCFIQLERKDLTEQLAHY